MKLLFFIFFFSLKVHAQIGPFDQSSPELNWNTIENNFIRVLYPQELKDESVYIANLVDHYSEFVGHHYNIQTPEQFTLVLRSDMSQPNGFVTLAPRRSEWYASTTYSPIVGTSEWYQTLAIHEYRHIIQYDYFKQGFAKAGRILFGDFGQQLMLFLGLQPWYFEGDAVLSETKYSDAGRGRSPRFLARMRAMIASGQFPSYEELVNGSYNTKLPNHYVFGYLLASRASQKFGEDIWQRIIQHVALLPHPFRLYTSFKKMTGQDFFEFYQETLNELYREWKDDIGPVSEYREYKYPHKIDNELFYLKYTLDSYWTLYKNDKKVAELPFINELNHLSMAQNKAVFAQYLPHRRYGFKSYSDIILLQLESGEKTKITHEQRLYHPRLNKNANNIIATEFTKDQRWALQEFDMSGNRLRNILIDGFMMNEAHYVTDDDVAVIMTDKTGQKIIASINLNTSLLNILLFSSRNNLFALNVDRNQQIFFEAQYLDTTNIFKINLSGEVQQCTQEKIAGYTPYSDGVDLHYSAEDANGANLKYVKVANCQQFDKAQLINYAYLDDSISSNYNKFPLQKINEQKQLYQKNKEQYVAKPHGDMDSQLLTPHSWNLLAGRGFNLLAQSDNFLRTIGIEAQIGSDAEENQNFAGLKIDYKKFYPVFEFSTKFRNRSVDPVNSANKVEWREHSVGTAVILPYTNKINLYNFENLLYAQLNYLNTSKYQLNFQPTNASHQSFLLSTVGFSTTIHKDYRYRSIVSPLAASYLAEFSNAENSDDANFNSYRTFQKLALQLPSLLDHHAFNILLSQETQRDSQTAYAFLPSDSHVLGNVFSRGYNYKNVPEYRKLSANYLFPLATPDWNLGGTYYLRRLIGNLFYDHTDIYAAKKNFTYSSYGAELELESKFFRILPINFGIRYVQRNLDDKEIYEFYLATEMSL